MDVYIMYSKGAWRVRSVGGAVEISGKDGKIILDARTITIPKESKVKVAEPSVKKRTLYVFHRDLGFIDSPPYIDLRAGQSRVYENFDLRPVDLDFEQYLTIVTPGSFLYDYAIITRKKTGVIMSAKREIYVEETKNSLIIYLV